MPQITISTPEHTAAVNRMTLGITTARGDAAAPSGCLGAPCVCSASEDE